MALKHSEKFIKDIVKNNDLRTSLYQYHSSAEIKAAICKLGYDFKFYEFEESINHLKTESPNEEQVFMLEDLLMWWNMLMFDGTIVEEEPQKCSPAKCSSCSICG